MQNILKKIILTIPLLVIVIFLKFHGLSEQKNTNELILLAAQNSAIKTIDERVRINIHK